MSKLRSKKENFMDRPNKYFSGYSTEELKQTSEQLINSIWNQHFYLSPATVVLGLILRELENRGIKIYFSQEEYEKDMKIKAKESQRWDSGT